MSESGHQRRWAALVIVSAFPPQSWPKRAIDARPLGATRTDMATKECHVRIPTNVDTAVRSPSGRPDRAASALPGWQIEAVWQRNPNNGLPLCGMARDVSLSVRVLYQDKAAGHALPLHRSSRTPQSRLASL